MLEPIEILQSRNGGPYAFKTRLGWCVVGPVNRTKRNKVSCNQIAVNQADTKEVGRHFFQFKKEVKENDLPDMLKQMYNHEFSESQHLVNEDVANMSQEDLKFIEILKNGTELVGGHYQVPLPFRKDEINLPNNRSQAEKRFACLERKLPRNPQFKQDYMKFMNELILKGYARESASAVEAGKCWYLPDHGVCHPNKPGKIRVVFDLSAEFNGTSINKALLPGPGLTNQIVGVLLQFREEQLAVTGDIEAMYHQVKVPENQRCFLLFLWWKDSDSSKVIADHEMTAHVFGGISSPSCSNCALKKTAVDNIKKHGEDVSSILRRNFYVGDMLKSFPSPKIAVDIFIKSNHCGRKVALILQNSLVII